MPSDTMMTFFISRGGENIDYFQEKDWPLCYYKRLLIVLFMPITIINYVMLQREYTVCMRNCAIVVLQVNCLQNKKSKKIDMVTLYVFLSSGFAALLSYMYSCPDVLVHDFFVTDWNKKDKCSSS